LRKLTSVILSAAILLVGINARAAGVNTSAVSAILMDASSGRVLYEKNAHELRLIASITKLMTALVAVETQPDLSKTVTVKGEWLDGAEGSSIYLRAGESLTLKELLYGMLLSSGNDAAQAVACYCAGDMETFALLMNQCAAGLGMKNSNFVNPSGLNAEGHYSTAYDMALCAKACMENEVIAEIVGTKKAAFGTRTFHNHNKLLSMYEGCVGLKTGYTERAGRTLVTCVEREGRRLIAVTLAAPDDWNDHIKMYEYGLERYRDYSLCSVEQTVRRLPVTGSLVRFVGVKAITDLSYPLTEGEQVETVINLPETIAAPVTEGEIAGNMEFFLAGEEIGSTYLVFERSVGCNLLAEKSFGERFREWLYENSPIFIMKFSRRSENDGRTAAENSVGTRSVFAADG